MTKLHQGELIKLLKEKTGVTYVDIAKGTGKSVRTIQNWEDMPELEIKNQELIAGFFAIDKNAFVSSKLRSEILSTIKPYKLKPIDEDPLNRVLKLEREMDQIKSLQEEILRILKQNRK